MAEKSRELRDRLPLSAVELAHSVADSTEVRVAQVYELYRHGMPGIAGALAGSVILTVALWPSVSQAGLTIWISCFLLSLVPRIALGFFFGRAAPVGEGAMSWANWFAVGTFTGGLFWSAIPVFLFPADNYLHQALMTFVMAGLCGGITVANAARRESQMPFILIVSVALVGRFLHEGGRDYTMMAILWVVFTVYLISAANRSHKTITESLRLRFENTSFIETLAAKNAESVNLNQELGQKITELQRADHALKLAHGELESRVEERTADLVRTNQELEDEIAERIKADKALRASEERYRLHFENIREVIFSYNAQLEVINVTPSVEGVLGYSASEFIGKSIPDLKIIPSDDLLRALRHSQRVLAGETINSKIYRFLHKDGRIRIGEVSGAPLMRDNEIVGVVSVARDITDRWEAEQSLRASEEKYRTIIENIEEGYFEVDLKGNMVLFNEPLLRIMGYSMQELDGMNYRNYMDQETAVTVSEIFNSVYTTGESAKMPNWAISRKDGTARVVETSVTLIRDSDGLPCGFRGLARDITERRSAEDALRKAHDELEMRVEERTGDLKRINEQLVLEIADRKCAEVSLRESEKRYRLLADNVSEIIWTMDLNLRQTYCSPSVERIRGYTVEEATAHSLDQILAPSSCELAMRTLSEELPTIRGTEDDLSRSWTLDLELIRKDGSTVWTEMNIRPLFDETGGPAGIQGVARDITLRRLNEEQLTSSLREKEILLREIHHRVKNNLQLMASMLDLQCHHCDDIASIDLLKEAQHRVWAMAVAHETLYQSGDLAKITARNYLGRLSEDLYGSVASGLSQVFLTTDIDNVPMKIDVSINCGLILSELLSNCLKHAFQGLEDGEVAVVLKMVDHDVIQLTVRDNGLGIAKDLDLEKTNSFGLKLVRMLVDELEGEMQIVSNCGTEFRVQFPNR